MAPLRKIWWDPFSFFSGGVWNEVAINRGSLRFLFSKQLVTNHPGLILLKRYVPTSPIMLEDTLHVPTSL